MPTFVMLTRVSPGTLESPASFQRLEEEAVNRIKTECPDVEWRENLALLGPYDYLDVFTAADNDTALKVSAIVRAHGHAHVEVWAAEDWKRFKSLVRDLP
ncbi:MAG: GYD domain-containing protein [Alphaproteobacteria bacterium]|jgi:uncharacterized protein with GYD domain|nr:GYD domain-containing protein [Alphaproteobacteria bacterium]